MEDKMKLELDIIALQKTIKKQVSKAFKEGVDTGAIVTCATIYKTFLRTGLEESNILFTIIKDIAKGHKCEDLPAYIQKMEEEKNT